MSPEKTKALQDKYPKIFGTSDPSEPYTTYGIECGDGWYDLLDVLCRNIQHHVDWKIERIPEEEREGFQVVATQIKQKFSTLRFYYNGGDDYTSGLIQMAEAMSGTICESCGDKASVRTKGWMTNLCNACNIKQFFKEKDFDLK
jgi:DNA-directed RNA polymerase subunit RPC12/RpoP